MNGDNEDGLHDPVLQMANLNDWEPFDIQKIINDQGDRKTGKLCTRSLAWMQVSRIRADCHDRSCWIRHE